MNVDDDVFNYFACDGCEVCSSRDHAYCSLCVLVQHVPVSMVLEFSLDILSSKTEV